MPKMTVFSVILRSKRLASFTLIELLTMIAIIAILTALVLSAGTGVMNKAARSRAAGEIQAMSTGLEGYKTDNGIYVPASSLITTSYAGNDGSQSGGLYQTASQILYLALSGQTNFTDSPVAGSKAYMAFKRNQVGDAAGGSYAQDPWRYSYGYSTGSVVGATTNAPYNGYGFFDIWSTGGLLAANVNTNAWISNWQ